MAKNDKVKKERQRSRSAAMDALRQAGGFPVPPRKAMSTAKKHSKRLPYPLPPYGSVHPLRVGRWVRFEWEQLGRWQRIAAPFAVLSALLTWEREREIQDARWAEIDKAESKEMAARSYGAYGPSKPKRRKLLGVIPLPGRK